MAPDSFGFGGSVSIQTRQGIVNGMLHAANTYLRLSPVGGHFDLFWIVPEGGCCMDNDRSKSMPGYGVTTVSILYRIVFALLKSICTRLVRVGRSIWGKSSGIQYYEFRATIYNDPGSD